MTPSLEGVTRFAHQAMSTEFEIFFSGLDVSYAEHTAQAAFGEINRIEALFSRFDHASEVSLINRLQPGRTMMVGAEVFECLSLAAQIQRETGGAFDISAPALLKYDSASRKAAYPDQDHGLRFPLVLDSSGKGFRVSLAEGFQEAGIDLGGIGKGYALDSLRTLLDDWDARNVLVQGGTSTALALGAAGEKLPGWPVGVGGKWKSPSTPRRIRLRNQALSGSGTGIKGGHIIDPETGRPAEGHLAVWTVHHSAAAADALSTAFMVMSTREVRDYCRIHPEVWALAVSKQSRPEVFNPDIVLESASNMEESS
ncbi:MAG: FAD:protein FMN transferase [Candidatus Aminicenantaceae bacterium]